MLRSRKTLTTIFLTALVALALPSAAAASESAYVKQGTLVYANDGGETDHVTIAGGGTAHPGKYLVSETLSPGLAAGLNCTALAASEVVCGGTVSTISVNTTYGADRVTIDVSVPATVYGVSDNDVLVGGGAGDWVFGGDGDDTLDGRGGADWLSGDAGNDVLEARDDGYDLVVCGSGVDTAYVDAADSTSGCETVIGPPGSAPDAPVVPGSDVVDPRDPTGAGVDVARDEGDDLTDAFDPAVVPTLLGPLRLATTQVAVSAQGVAAFDLTCATTEPAGCRGTFYLDPVLGKGKAGVKDKGTNRGAKVRAVAARRGRYGRSPFVIAGGKRKKVKVKLSAHARTSLGLTRSSGKARAARRGRAVSARVTVVQNGRRAVRTVVRLRG